jgi:hypothetical protein
MRYLSIYRPAAGVEGTMPDAQHMAAMGALVEEMMAKGVLESTGPLAPRADGVRVTLKDGQFITADETERAGGYAFLHAASKAEVIEQAKAFLKVAGDGTCEIRAVPDFGPPPAAA